MNEQASVSEAQKAQLTTHLEELEQEIAQKEEEIRALEQHQSGATTQPQTDLHGEPSMTQQTLAAMRKNADVIRAQLARPAVPSSSAQSHQRRGARIY